MNRRHLDFIMVLLAASAALALFWLAAEVRHSPLLFIVLLALAVPALLANFVGVPFFPAPWPAVERMLAEARLRPGDRVYDIGCGDGRVVYLAARDHAAKATGLEFSPPVFLLAKLRQALWRSRAEIRFGNYKWLHFSDADAVFCYLNPALMKELEGKLAGELKPGARVVSYAYRLPAWKPARTVRQAGVDIFIYEV